MISIPLFPAELIHKIQENINAFQNILFWKIPKAHNSNNLEKLHSDVPLKSLWFELLEILKNEMLEVGNFESLQFRNEEMKNLRIQEMKQFWN